MAHKPVFRYVSYDTAKYPFADIVAKSVLHTDDLSRFHEQYLASKRARGGKGVLAHDDNMAAREHLKTLDQESEFFRLYNAFVREVIDIPLFQGKVTPVRPVFRVQMAHSNSVSLWHRDVEVTGCGIVLTAWIPFVDTFGSNTIWVETEYGKKDYAPLPVRYGQILFFDSAWLWHGSVRNDTEATRVSMDIRLLPPRTDDGKLDLGIFAPRPDWCVDAIEVPKKNSKQPDY